MENRCINVPEWLKSYLITSLILMIFAGMMLDGGKLFGLFFLADIGAFLLLLLLQLFKIRMLKKSIDGILTPISIMLVIALAITFKH